MLVHACLYECHDILQLSNRIIPPSKLRELFKRQAPFAISAGLYALPLVRFLKTLTTVCFVNIINVPCAVLDFGKLQTSCHFTKHLQLYKVKVTGYRSFYMYVFVNGNPNTIRVDLATEHYLHFVHCQPRPNVTSNLEK